MLGKKYSGNSNDPGNSRNARKRDNKIIFGLILFLVLFSFLGIYLVNDNYITGAFLGILPIEEPINDSFIDDNEIIEEPVNTSDEEEIIEEETIINDGLEIND